MNTPLYRSRRFILISVSIIIASSAKNKPSAVSSHVDKIFNTEKANMGYPVESSSSIPGAGYTWRCGRSGGARLNLARVYGRMSAMVVSPSRRAVKLPRHIRPYGPSGCNQEFQSRSYLIYLDEDGLQPPVQCPFSGGGYWLQTGRLHKLDFLAGASVASSTSQSSSANPQWSYGVLLRNPPTYQPSAVCHDGCLGM